MITWTWAHLQTPCSVSPPGGSCGGWRSWGSWLPLSLLRSVLPSRFLKLNIFLHSNSFIAVYSVSRCCWSGDGQCLSNSNFHPLCHAAQVSLPCLHQLSGQMLWIHWSWPRSSSSYRIQETIKELAWERQHQIQRSELQISPRTTSGAEEYQLENKWVFFINRRSLNNQL